MQILKKTVTGLGVAALSLTVLGIMKKPGSVYQNNPEEKNPMEGKKVIFVEDPSEPVNADGVRGHLKAVGRIDHTPSFYEKRIKRFLDVVLSFGGLVVLSPVFLGLGLWIIMDDPGPVLFTQKRIGMDKQYFKLHNVFKIDGDMALCNKVPKKVA